MLMRYAKLCSVTYCLTNVLIANSCPNQYIMVDTSYNFVEDEKIQEASLWNKSRY